MQCLLSPDGLLSLCHGRLKGSTRGSARRQLPDGGFIATHTTLQCCIAPDPAPHSAPPQAKKFDLEPLERRVAQLEAAQPAEKKD